MSNPYDPGYQPYRPAPVPGGEPGSYGVPGPYDDPRTRTDGISIAALVCSLSCCAAPVGVGLGIAGLVRTSGGRRRGRWAAVTGVAVGAVASLLLVSIVVGLTWLGFRVVDEADVEVGDCFDASALGDAENDLWRAGCDEAHDGQAFAVGTFADPADARTYVRSRSAFCEERLSKAPLPWRELLGDDTYLSDGATDALIEDEADSLDGDDTWVCFLRRADGEQLTGDLRDDVPGTTGA